MIELWTIKAQSCWERYHVEYVSVLLGGLVRVPHGDINCCDPELKNLTGLQRTSEVERHRLYKGLYQYAWELSNRVQANIRGASRGYGIGYLSVYYYTTPLLISKTFLNPYR